MTNVTQGRILHVDLNESRLETENPPVEFYRKYVGGSAMGLVYILRHMLPRTDPLGSGNVLTLMLSVLTGAPISGQSRISANAGSPLVDGIGDSQGGGYFPAEMRFAGFDGLVVRGKAERPVYLWLHDGHAELRPASHLWGKTTSEVDDLLKSELDDDRIQIAQCGPAGEKLVRLAAIINMGNRANGRTGMGAVMGSKNLKAVVVRGTDRHLEWADPKRINRLAKAGAMGIENNPSVLSLRRYGTAGGVPYQNETGTLPTFNYQAGQFHGYEAISGETMAETILKRSETCFACTVRCKRVVETQWAGRPVEDRFGGPEYESVAALGSYCGISDLDAIAMANKLCNDYGLDTIGTGATIAWALECFERGILSAQDIGFPASFGDAEAMVRLTEMIGRREGIGDVLAEGSLRAAAALGRGSELLITVKGSEAPAHMPQAKRSLGLIYAVNPFGADHQSSEHDPSIEKGASELFMQRNRLLGFDHTLAPRTLDSEKVRYAFKTQQFYSFLDSADLCQFVWGPAWTLYGPEETVAFVRAATGWEDFTLGELLEIGERRLNLLRVFNAREGIDRRADRLPAKFFEPLKGSGPTAGVALNPNEMDAAKDEYYRQAGWDQSTGNPTPETLARLGLDWVK